MSYGRYLPDPDNIPIDVEFPEMGYSRSDLAYFADLGEAQQSHYHDMQQRDADRIVEFEDYDRDYDL